MGRPETTDAFSSFTVATEIAFGIDAFVHPLKMPTAHMQTHPIAIVLGMKRGHQTTYDQDNRKTLARHFVLKSHDTHHRPQDGTTKHINAL